MLAPTSLKEPSGSKDTCGDETPDPSLCRGVREIMAFEKLHSTYDHERSAKNGEEALDPKFCAHENLPCDA